MTTSIAAAPPSPSSEVMIQTEFGPVHIPPGVNDLASFRRWLHSGTFPEKARVCFFDGRVWVDTSMERFFAHNQVKFAIGQVLGALILVRALGRYSPDGMHLSHSAAGLSTQPDGIFASFASIQSGRVRLVSGAVLSDGIDLEGTPDMVLEVVSDSSVTKDCTTLPVLYHAAGIPEFWRADARNDLCFEIFRHTPAGYVPTQLSDGWWRSDVFGEDFRLTRGSDVLGPVYTLETR